MCFNQRGDISTLNAGSLKLVDKFPYLGCSVSSTKTSINTRLEKAWTAINRLSIIWKSDLTDKIKYSFFQAAVVSILFYGCTTLTLTKCMEKKLDIYTSGDASLFFLLVPPPDLCQLQFPTRGPWTQSKSS